VTAGFFDLPINASFVAASEPVMPHLKKNDFGDRKEQRLIWSKR
jgi:hypothetical protein